MIIIKDNTVNITGLSPQMTVLLITMNSLFEHNGVNCVITSANDAVHSNTSLHYNGCALDFRIKHIELMTAKEIVRKANDALGQDFDIILESNHIHAEYQPKRR